MPENFEIDKSNTKWPSMFHSMVAAGLFPKIEKVEGEYKINTAWGKFSLLTDIAEDEYDLMTSREKNDYALNRYRQLQFWQTHPEEKKRMEEQIWFNTPGLEFEYGRRQRREKTEVTETANGTFETINFYKKSPILLPYRAASLLIYPKSDYEAEMLQLEIDNLSMAIVIENIRNPNFMANLNININEFPKPALYEVNELYKQLGQEEIDLNNALEVKRALLHIVNEYKGLLKTYVKTK